MKAAIYYFSGTGNSLVIARDIAARLNAELIPIPLVVENERITCDADVIGIVFPVYNAVYQGMPAMVRLFANKLAKLDAKYIFTICTCLGWSHITIKNLGEIIKARGGELAAGFTVNMPDNSSPVSTEKQQRLFNKWKKKLESIYQYIASGKKGRYENPDFFNLIMIPFLKGGKKKTLQLYSKLAESTGLTYEELVHLSDRSFVVDHTCTGCGICARVCPANDIVMAGNRPVWQHCCESCLACVNWCPEKAITGSILIGNKTPVGYHHPLVKLSDMSLRNQ